MSTIIRSKHQSQHHVVHDREAERDRTVRFLVHPVKPQTAEERLSISLAQPVASDALGLMFDHAVELEEARKRDEEERRREAEAARARFAAD